jgi:hypothetical protein
MFYVPLNGADLERFEQSLECVINTYGREHVFVADHLITFYRNLGFTKDPAFVHAFTANSATLAEKSLLWRLHVLCWAGAHAMSIPGDFVECGVYEGFSSRVVTQYLSFEKSDKSLWLYDLFDHTEQTDGTVMPSHGPSLMARVQKRFADYPNTKIVKGLIPESFQQGLPEAISWFHLDLNNAPAETAALEHLFDRMTPGAILILDDYGWGTLPKQQIAADKFAREHAHAILELPTGQGLLIKR